ncbi:ATP-binding cassette domain-containing protein [Streptomyces sp. NPDC059009]|uniref:ATP-binding cassette domain-containing protein n=1 Tax=Streptomyces sp. NPDC059009 TaxID=3346694 RepID=UPI003673FE8E
MTEMTTGPATGAARPGAGVPIEARGLSKRYGTTVAVDDLTFTVQPGKVTGFVGPNGAGKSTTLRMVLGLDAADRGEALIGGRPYAALGDPLTVVGALLDSEALHPGRRARDHLLWLAHYSGLPRRRVDAVLDLVGLASAAKKRTGGFSLGMRQRLGIAAALLGDPPVLILDEPVNGLDPEGVQWIRVFLKSLAGEGRTVLVSSHLMSELQGTADHLVVIGRGRLLADTDVASLLDAASGERVALRTERRAEALMVLTGAGATVAVTGPDSLTVTGLAAERVVALLGAEGVPFSELARHRATLEEAYMELAASEGEFMTHTETAAGSPLEAS